MYIPNSLVRKKDKTALNIVSQANLAIKFCSTRVDGNQLSGSSKIDELNEKLSALKEQENRLGAELDEFMGKRDALNEQSRTLRAKAAELRDRRDESNEKVKWLKQQRTDLQTRIHDKVEELKKLREERRTLEGKTSRSDFRALQKAFEDIEWKIQTTSLSMEEEKELIKQASKKEAQLGVYKRLSKIDARIQELQADIKRLDKEREQSHKTLTDLAEKSQQAHQEMLAQIEDSKKAKAEADHFHGLHAQTRESLKEVQKEIRQVVDELKLLKAGIRQEEDSKRKKAEESICERLEKQARDKMKRGEKLSWEEFQLLAEKGMEAQD